MNYDSDKIINYDVLIYLLKNTIEQLPTAKFFFSGSRE